MTIAEEILNKEKHIAYTRTEMLRVCQEAEKATRKEMLLKFENAIKRFKDNYYSGLNKKQLFEKLDKELGEIEK